MHSQRHRRRLCSHELTDSNVCKGWKAATRGRAPCGQLSLLLALRQARDERIVRQEILHHLDDVLVTPKPDQGLRSWPARPHESFLQAKDDLLAGTPSLVPDRTDT